MDPADCLKLGIKWRNQYYINKSVAFSWVHGTAAYQLLSDSIAFMMKDKANIHCYFDDYVVVLPESKANVVFNYLCALLNELGLPLNEHKFQ